MLTLRTIKTTSHHNTGCIMGKKSKTILILNLLVCLFMPYYRIVIWTKIRKAPYSGIKLIANPNINAVHQEFSQRSNDKFRDKMVDLEVQMLSKLSTAVKLFERKQMLNRD